MKNYRITVNGTSYDVSVEELSGGAAPVAAPVAAAPVAAPAPAAAPAAPAPAAGGAGSVKVSSPMPGKILAVKANVGDSVIWKDYDRYDPCQTAKPFPLLMYKTISCERSLPSLSSYCNICCEQCESKCKCKYYIHKYKHASVVLCRKIWEPPYISKSYRTSRCCHNKAQRPRKITSFLLIHNRPFCFCFYFLLSSPLSGQLLFIFAFSFADAAKYARHLAG